MRLFYVLFVFAGCFFQDALSARILVVMPFPLYSHSMPFLPIFKALADKGHHVTYLSPFANKVSSPNLKGVQLNITVPKIVEFGTFTPTKFIGWWYEMFALWKFCPGMTSFMVSEIQEYLPPKSEKFDVVIVEPHFCQEPLGILAHYYNAHLVTVMPGPVNPSIAYHTGTPTNPSYIPLIRSAYTDHMDFWDRFMNTILTVTESIGHRLYQLPKQDKFMREWLKDPNLPYLGDVLSNVSLSLVETHYSINYARPYSKNVLEVGAILPPVPDPLPADLEKYINESEHGVIFFSWGSHFEGKKELDRALDAIMESFKYVKQRVLFKMSNRKFHYVPKNVLIRPWLPQPSVLSHKNVVLFITHCGLNSIYEAAHHAVPIIGTPVFADQFHNIKLMEHLGLGVGLDPRTITSYTQVLYAMNKVLDNSSYIENAKRQAELIRDRPMSSLDEAVYWIEYVIRYGGAKHLRPASADMPWYKVYLVDIVAFLMGIIFSVLLFLCCIFKKCFGESHLRTNKKKKKQ